MEIKLTPKRVALAIGVSESSMKRWCDRGLIECQKTAGGHRRVLQSSIIHFLRSSNHSLIRPELLGLPEGTQRQSRSQSQATQDYTNALINGDEPLASRIFLESYIAGLSIAEIGDQIIKPTFKSIGEMLRNDEIDQIKQHRACEISTRVALWLKSLLPSAPDDGLLAIGASPESDDQFLPSILVEMSLQELGWRAQSLGAKLPFSRLLMSAEQKQPSLFWLTVSEIRNESEFQVRFEQFRKNLSRSIHLVVGGQGINTQLRAEMKTTTFADSLQQLCEIAGMIDRAQKNPPTFDSSGDGSTPNPANGHTRF